MIPRPQTDEYGAYYGRYINYVPEGADVLALLSSQPDSLAALLSSISDEAANVRPAPSEWSVKEVLGHICDTERIFAYRALSAARGEAQPLNGFEQNDYVAATDFNTRTVADLVEEFALQRRANLLTFKPLTDVELTRRGTASGQPITPRAVIYMMAGHVMHHVESLETVYKVGA